MGTMLHRNWLAAQERKAEDKTQPSTSSNEVAKDAPKKRTKKTKE